MNNCLLVLLFGMINFQATIYEQKCLVPPEEQAIKLVQCLFEQICEDKPISKADAAKYFGYHGGILEEILHKTLANADPAKHKGYEKDAQAYSPLGILLSAKLKPLLHDKKRFSFAWAPNIYTLDKQSIPRAGAEPAVMLLFVRAIPETEENYFNEIGNGINFVFGLRYTSNARDTIYIELINSYINGKPFYKVLGFSGKCASCLKLAVSEQEVIYNTLDVKLN